MIILLLFMATAVVCLAVFLKGQEPVNWDDSWEQVQDAQYFQEVPLEVPREKIVEELKHAGRKLEQVVQFAQYSADRPPAVGKPRARKTSLRTQIDPLMAATMAKVYQAAEDYAQKNLPRETLAYNISAFACLSTCEGVYHDDNDYKCLCGGIDKYMPFIKVAKELQSGSMS